MANPELESIRRKMVYDKKETPVKNIEGFFESVKTLRYEWGQITIDGKKTYYLDSAWKNEAGLQDITFKFQSSFLEHLYEISTEKVKAENFLEYLNGCRNILRIANHRYSTDLVNITVFKIRDSLAISPIPVEYDSLPVAVQIKVSNCFLLLVAFFRELKDNIEEEVSDYERKQTILKNASYVWTSDKSDLSELALAILARQAERFKDNNGIYCNAQMEAQMMQEICQITDAGKTLLSRAMQKLNLSARVYDRILKVSHTHCRPGRQLRN